MRLFFATAIAALALAACGSQPAANDSAASADSAAANQSKAKAELPTCPFKAIQDLRGSITGGTVLVTGRVDLMMAGFKPQLTPRPGGSGALLLDLALVPEANAGVSDVLRYEAGGSPGYRRGEVWCGGRRLASFDIILVG